MRVGGLLASLLIAAAVAWRLDVWVGLLIAAASSVYLLIAVVRKASAQRSARGAAWWELARNVDAVFLVPFIVAVLTGEWLGAVATLLVFLIMLRTA
jgi:hypothetical protein